MSLPVIQLKYGTSGNAVPTLLMKCGTAGNAVPTLLRSCPPPRLLCSATQIQFLLTGPFTPVCVELNGKSYRVSTFPSSLAVTMPLGENAGTMDLVGSLVVDEHFDTTDCSTPRPIPNEMGAIMYAWICTTNGFDYGTPYLTYVVLGYHVIGPLVLYSGYIKCADAIEGAALPNNGAPWGYASLCNVVYGQAICTGGSLTGVYA